MGTVVSGEWPGTVDLFQRSGYYAVQGTAPPIPINEMDLVAMKEERVEITKTVHARA